MTPMMFPYLMYRCWLQMFFPRPTYKVEPYKVEPPARYEG